MLSGRQPRKRSPLRNHRTRITRTPFTGRDRITEAWIYFTTARGPWKSRKWHFIQCTIGEKELVAQKALPKETVSFLVYVFRNVGGFRSNHAASELVVTANGPPR